MIGPDRRRRGWRFLPCALAICAAIPACAGKQRNCVPPDLALASPQIDLAATPGEYRPVDREEIEALTARLRRDDGPPDLAKRKLQILALSGGGKLGAYTVGVLNGWSAAGSRPQFDVVTGVSTGSLIATYAFLGPRYDAQLRCLYTTMESRDVVRRRPKLAILWSDAAFSSAPLARLIAEEIDDQVLAQVAAAHAQGRRLFVGTTNLDTRRLVIWDMGAIACSQRPDRLDLFRTVLLASCSVPGAMPPVKITVTINGQQYTELHGDGGATDALFLRASFLGVDPELVRAGRKPLAGSNLYIIIAGKLFADPACTKLKLLDVAGSAVSSLTFSQTRGELIRQYMICLLGGMDYHLTALAQDVPVNPDSLKFEPAELQRLFDAGFCDGLAPARWRTTPVGAEPGEQPVPRSGTDFLAPVTIPLATMQ